MYSYSSCAKNCIHFCACAGECLLKSEEQNFQKKTVIILIFKLKALVFDNKANLDGDIWIKLHVAFVIKVWVDIRKMNTSKLTKLLTSIVIFQYRLVRWCKLEIHPIGRPSGIHTGYQQESLQKELSVTHIDFAILNSQVTVIFKIYQKHEFLCGNTEKFKIAVFFPAIYPCI